jgi:3'-phosphoadenosine 5'-phosphosulfate sulfotransferase (PAPS reductase)/FAD synthetase
MEFPSYAKFDTWHKIAAIKSIIAKRLTEYPKAICSYSGGSDSDIMLHLLETVRKQFLLPPIKYIFVNTGLEIVATKRHVEEVQNIYDVEIETIRPKMSIITSARKYGIPFISKVISDRLKNIYLHNTPFELFYEYQKTENKQSFMEYLYKKYPNQKQGLQFICSCNTKGVFKDNTQISIISTKYLLEFLIENRPNFKISAECCNKCKKQPLKKAQKGYELIITGERYCEGGERTAMKDKNTCFLEYGENQYRLKPIFFLTNEDKRLYKDYYNIKFSNAYELYGLKRTGCCGCPISATAVKDLELIGEYEPNIKKAAWNIFGDSYLFRQQFNEFKRKKKLEFERQKRLEFADGSVQLELFREEDG